MTSTARQLRQPPTIEAIERVPYFADACLVEGEIKKYVIKDEITEETVKVKRNYLSVPVMHYL